MQYFNEINRFKAVAESGEEFIVVEYQAIYRKHPGFAGEVGMPTQKDYETDEGNPLRRLDDDSFQFVITGEIIKRI